MAQCNRRFLRAQFALNSPPFLPITYGSIFQVLGKCRNGSLEAMNVASGQKGLIPRSSQVFYVEVYKSELPYVQPVIIIGSFSSHIQDLLIEREPQLFMLPVPHTSRVKRVNEQNGKHYWFVRRTTMEQMLDQNLFIDYAELAGNLYGVSEASVRLVVQKERRHCLLDTSTSVKRLLHRGLFPIVIFIGAETWKTLHDVTALDGFSESQTQEEIAKDDIQLRKMTPYLNAVLRENSLEASYQKVLDIILSLRKEVWLPQIDNPNQRLI